MVDDNTGTAMYESDDIIDYLYDKYGPGKDKVSSLLRAGALTILTAGFGLVGIKKNSLDAVLSHPRCAA